MPTKPQTPFAAKTTSLRNIMDLLRTNEDLIAAIVAAGEASAAVVKDLFRRLEEQRAQAEALHDRVDSGKVSIRVGENEEVRERQRKILLAIEEASKQMQIHRDDPALAAIHQGTRAGLYVALASTYNEAAAQIVTFTQAESDEIRTLIRRATLDAIARQRLADVLDAAVQISKLALRVALKVVAF